MTRAGGTDEQEQYLADLYETFRECVDPEAPPFVLIDAETERGWERFSDKVLRLVGIEN